MYKKKRLVNKKYRRNKARLKARKLESMAKAKPVKKIAEPVADPRIEMKERVVKAPAKEPAVKKTAVKKPAAKKTTTKKPVTKKAASKKSTAKKAPAKKTKTKK
jgi:hypothetical protein